MDRQCYFLLNLLYGVAAVCTLLLGVVFVNYEVVSQAVLLASLLYPAGVLSTMEPGPVKRRTRVKFCVGAFVSLVFVAMAVINPAATLLAECPDLDPHRLDSHASNRLDIVVRYTHHDLESGRETQRFLLLEYDLRERRIVRKEQRRHRREEEEDDDGEERSWLEIESHRLRELEEPVCSSHNVSRFHFLEREVRRELREKRREAQDRPAIRVTPHRSEDQGREALKELRRRLDNREICLYEYGFTLLYLGFIASVFVLELVALLWVTFLVKDIE
jgi:hypothetical protein